jgi:hypothetical protein
MYPGRYMNVGHRRADPASKVHEVMMSTTLRGVALGLSAPVVIAISAWAGWSALTANLAPAEISVSDESRLVDISNSARSEMPAAEPEIEPAPGPEQLGAALERAQPAPPPRPDSDMAVAPANVAYSAIKPATTGQAEPMPAKSKIRFVRVPKALAASLNSTAVPEQASGEKVASEVKPVEPARRHKKAQR